MAPYNFLILFESWYTFPKKLGYFYKLNKNVSKIKELS